MESPVVLDKPPEYGKGKDDRGFPFEEDESSSAWNQFVARHPDLESRLRAYPQSLASKRRPIPQGQDEDFGEDFRGFDRFPFSDIPPEFREHFPHLGGRYRQEQPQSHQQQQQQPAEQPPPQPPKQQTQSTSTQTTATQTEPPPEAADPQTVLPQYGLRNTVDLGQDSPAHPGLVDADERSQRAMSAPPDASGPAPEHDHHVRHIPIFVEGRDEPVVNRGPAGPSPAAPPPHFAEAKPPHVERDQYFPEEHVGFHAPPNFSRAFGTPFSKGFRQGPQPFVQQKVYPQNAFARGQSPQRSQSPRPADDHFVKVPVHHEAPRQQPAPKQQPQQKQHPAPQQQAPPPPPPQAQQPPPPPQPGPNDPITQILSIQTDVLNLMTDVENFTGSKKDKKYMYLDEMLTRNLIKLDNIETEGKENIRQARKEAIKCIQKCIAVLEAKADKSAEPAPTGTDVDMDSQPPLADHTDPQGAAPADTADTGPGPAPEGPPPDVAAAPAHNGDAPPLEETKEEHVTDTRTDDKPADKTEEKPAEKKTTPKKKAVKKRDKSKDNKEKQEEMQVDDKGDALNMDVDASASQ